jgi:hypothetical protein
MVYTYNPQGALNGLFAPPYIPGNPQAVSAATAYNTARQAQLRPTTPPPVVPGTGTPPPGPLMPPQRSLDPAALSGGGSFTFIEPTLPSVQQPGATSVTPQAPVNRNSIAMALMRRA